MFDIFQGYITKHKCRYAFVGYMGREDEYTLLIDVREWRPFRFAKYECLYCGCAVQFPRMVERTSS